MLVSDVLVEKYRLEHSSKVGIKQYEGWLDAISVLPERYAFGVYAKRQGFSGSVNALAKLYREKSSISPSTHSFAEIAQALKGFRRAKEFSMERQWQQAVDTVKARARCQSSRCDGSSERQSQDATLVSEISSYHDFIGYPASSLVDAFSLLTKRERFRLLAISELEQALSRAVRLTYSDDTTALTGVINRLQAEAVSDNRLKLSLLNAIAATLLAIHWDDQSDDSLMEDRLFQTDIVRLKKSGVVLPAVDFRARRCLMSPSTFYFLQLIVWAHGSSAQRRQLGSFYHSNAKMKDIFPLQLKWGISFPVPTGLRLTVWQRCQLWVGRWFLSLRVMSDLIKINAFFRWLSFVLSLADSTNLNVESAVLIPAPGNLSIVNQLSKVDPFLHSQWQNLKQCSDEVLRVLQDNQWLSQSGWLASVRQMLVGLYTDTIVPRQLYFIQGMLNRLGDEVSEDILQDCWDEIGKMSNHLKTMKRSIDECPVYQSLFSYLRHCGLEKKMTLQVNDFLDSQGVVSNALIAKHLARCKKQRDFQPLTPKKTDIYLSEGNQLSCVAMALHRLLAEVSISKQSTQAMQSILSLLEQATAQGEYQCGDDLYKIYSQHLQQWLDYLVQNNSCKQLSVTWLAQWEHVWARIAKNDAHPFWSSCHAAMLKRVRDYQQHTNQVLACRLQLELLKAEFDAFYLMQPGKKDSPSAGLLDAPMHAERYTPVFHQHHVGTPTSCRARPSVAGMARQTVLA